MEEGLATYVEPLGRARTGLIAVEQVWSELLDGLPKGLPGAGDRGLDRTPTWGRTYWGGALFWFLADVEIRRRTSGRRGLDALRAIVVRRDEGHVRFDEAAPLAWVRRAITATESAARAPPPGARPPKSVVEAPPT